MKGYQCPTQILSPAASDSTLSPTEQLAGFLIPPLPAVMEKPDLASPSWGLSFFVYKLSMVLFQAGRLASLLHTPQFPLGHILISLFSQGI